VRDQCDQLPPLKGVAAHAAQDCDFPQVNRAQPHMHHDALELPDGHTVLLTFLCEGQEATVLQLPAQPTTESEARDQERVAYAG
jgi:hypothetical protein